MPFTRVSHSTVFVELICRRSGFEGDESVSQSGENRVCALPGINLLSDPRFSPT
jgi:hypothetical protein